MEDVEHFQGEILEYNRELKAKESIILEQKN